MTFKVTRLGAPRVRQNTIRIGDTFYTAGDFTSGITVEDEGSPLTTDATTLDFTGGGVTASGSGTTKTINIPGGGSGTGHYLDTLALDTDMTHFDEAGVPTGWTRPSGLSSGDETWQYADGSHGLIQLASTGGAAVKAYYATTTNSTGDGEWICGLSSPGVNSSSNMNGIGIADSSGDGVAAIVYQAQVYTISIVGGQFSQLRQLQAPLFQAQSGIYHWLRLRRATNDWFASLSTDGLGWGIETAAWNQSVTAARVYAGCYFATTNGHMHIGLANRIA